MIGKNELKVAVFNYVQTPWKEEKTWVFVYDLKDSINCNIEYDIESQTAKTVLSEFCIISRKCENYKDLKTFINAIEFIENK